MSKQTFTTGQVLTAAQVNALQTNDFNQDVSVKTAAYTLVAADKGTRIEFNTSGSVTVTVNSGLFDAGDTLIIQNRGAGTATVTAGTATVNTSATLALSQYDSGTLYFVSNSSAIFFNSDAGEASSGGMTLISTTALSGASVTLSSIAQTFNNLVIVLRDFELAASTGGHLQYQLNADTTANAHRQISLSGQGTTITTAAAVGTSFTTVDDTVGFNPATNSSQITIFDYTNTSSIRLASILHAYGGNTGAIFTQNITGRYTSATAVSSVKIALSAGTFSAGSALLYGVK